MKKYFLILVMMLSLPFNVFAATQGTLGLSSTGTVLITVTISGVMQISNLSDITISYTPGTNTAQVRTVNVCVYSNNLTSSNYYITATSANASGATLRVSNGAGTPAYIPYTLQWYTQSAAAGTATALTSAIKSTSAFTGANSSSVTCSGTQNASFSVTFAAAALEAAGAGSYTDTLTLLLSAS